MKLRFVLGIPGSGKSSLCINEIVQTTSQGRQALYIVPEQYSLESERILSEKSKNNVLINSEVLSFAHLAHRILLKTGNSNEKILEESGKSLLLRKILNSLSKKDKLLFYGKSVSRQGFIDNISSLITECIRYSVSPELLLKKSAFFEESNKNLSSKLNDIGLIYSEFAKNIEERYIAKDSLLDILADRIPTTNIFKDTEVWIDSFTDFTPQEFNVIKALLKVCNRVNIALTVQSPNIDGKFNTFDPYYEAKRSIKHIRRIADSVGAITEPTIFLDKDVRHTSCPEIHHLTYNYFKGTPYTDKCNNIKIYSAASTELELSHIAGEILTLLREKKYRCSDIAVLISSDKYYQPLKNIFEKYNIPYFTDHKIYILFHPFTELVRSIFKAISSNFDTPQVFTLLKTGFNDLTYQEIAFAENYCIACGIRGKKWFKEWEYTLGVKYEDKLNDLNDIRSNICDMLDRLNSLNSKNNHTILEISTELYKLFDYFKVKEKLNDLINDANANNNQTAVRLHTQIWDIISNIFNKMCEIMGDDNISITEYGKLLETGLQNAAMGLIPPTCDSVTIAEISRSRLPNIKALFMLGVNEGVVPPHHNDINLLSDNDRAELIINGCELGGDSLRLINRDRYNIYSAITKPSEKLYLSYNSELEGGIKSTLVQDLCNVFSIEPTEILSTVTNVEGIYSDEQAFELLLKHLSALDNEDEILPVYRAIYAHLANSTYKERLNSVENWLSYSDPTDEEISSELAEQLYLTVSKNLISGITRLQDYASCPYMFFLKHGLKAYEREEYTPSSLDYGTFLHSVLKSFSDRVQKELDWQNVDAEYITANVSSIVDKTIADYSTGYLSSSAYSDYIGSQLKKTAIATINAFTQNIEGFVPCGYEITFGVSADTKLPPLKYDLNNGTKLVLTGSIDRVDMFTDANNNTYVKITDYKTSNYTKNIFSTEKLYLGIQLQLPLYMEAYTKNNPGIKPGGYFYFRIDNPVLDKYTDSPYNELIGGGIAVDNPDVISALSSFEQKKLNNSRISTFFTLPEEKITKLNNKVNSIITNIGRDIVSGTIKAHPYMTSKGSNPCSFCQYSAICCFELCSNKRNKYRTLTIDEDISVDN